MCVKGSKSDFVSPCITVLVNGEHPQTTEVLMAKEEKRKLQSWKKILNSRVLHHRRQVKRVNWGRREQTVTHTHVARMMTWRAKEHFLEILPLKKLPSGLHESVIKNLKILFFFK